MDPQFMLFLATVVFVFVVIPVWISILMAEPDERKLTPAEMYIGFCTFLLVVLGTASVLFFLFN